VTSQNGSSDFDMPPVELGDMVYYYSSALDLTEPVLGWVCRRPGVKTVCILVFSPDLGFVEKPSVRHLNDPGLQENPSWRQWGAWILHPKTELLKRLETILPQMVTVLAKHKKD
jgi:hypothetical protein